MTANTMPHRLAWIGMPVGGVGIIAGAFLPWAQSGRVSRSAFQLADVAGRLGALDAVPMGAAFVMPLLCAVPTLLLALRLVRAAGAVAAMVSIAALLGAGVALHGLSDRTGMVRIAGAGPWVTVVAASLLLTAAFATVRWWRSPRRTAQVPGSAATPPVASHERDVTP